MVDEWEKDGVKPMLYMNPFFANLTGEPAIRDNLFQEGDEKGYFVHNTSGKTDVLKSGSIDFAMLDFTNPAAREWGKNIIKNNMIGEGRGVGWMADFSEYAPLVAQYADLDGPSETYHNRYPYEWGRLNQEAIREAGREDDIVYFMRAGGTYSPSITPLVWMGDQMHTYDHFDGLQSALIGMLNGGICGFGIGHSDIGGYTTIW